jgi:hypothetical protein
MVLDPQGREFPLNFEQKIAIIYIGNLLYETIFAHFIQSVHYLRILYNLGLFLFIFRRKRLVDERTTRGS